MRRKAEANAGPKVSPEDVELFHRTVGAVKPLRQNRGVVDPRVTGATAASKAHKRPKRKRPPRTVDIDVSLTAAVAAVAPVKGEDELSFRRNGISAGRLRELRRGEVPVDEAVDLHGLTEAQAHKVLVSFLAAAVGRRARCVRIVHGKGLRSGERGPVLKNVVNAVLRQSGLVLGYVSARPTDGGTGATYALLVQRP